ncbi:MAG: AsmA family protein [Georgfuchsia sp.]
MKIAKIVGIVFAAIVLVLAALAAYVAFTFDAARIKQEVAQAVLAKTGRTLTIDGDLALSFWPSLGVKVNKVALSERNGKDRFAAFDAAHVAVKVMPLLSKQIVVERVELEGLKLTLIRDREGHLNIDDLLGGKKDNGEKTPPPEFDVAGIDITNAQIEWRDQKGGSTLQIADLGLSTGRAIGNNDGVHVEAFKLTTRGKLDADNFDLALDVPDLMHKGEQITAVKVSLEANLKGAARSAAASLEVSDIEGSPQALKIGGLVLDFDAQIGDKSLKGNLKSPLALDLGAGTVLLADLSGALALDMPSLPVHPLKLPIKGRIQSDYSKPAVSGNLATQFDETHIDAHFNVAGKAPMNIGFELDINKLNLDKYLPPADNKPAADTIDLSALKGLNASGNLRVGELQVKNIKMRNLRVNFKAAKGRIDIAPHSTDLYGGHVSGSASVDADGNRIALKESLSGINIQPLLKDLADKDIIEGKGDVALDIATRGATVAAMKQALSGNARTVLRDGAIKGINLAQSLRAAKARLGGGDVAQQANVNDKTDFSELSASFTIANGVAHNDDLMAKSPFLRLGGSGDIDIGNSRLNYLLKAAVVGSAAGQGGKELDSLKGVTVPVRVSGPFEKPSFKLELANLVNDAAKQRIDEKKQELQQKLQDNLKGQLKGLFGK